MENIQNKKIYVGQFSKKIWLLSAIVVLVMIVVLVAGLSDGKTKSETPVMKISTPYIDLILPLGLEEYVTNDESTNGTIYTRAFYMNYGEEEQPLWRIDFGDPNAGDWVGMLKTDDGDVSVTITGFAISAEELTALGEEGSQLYSECMQGYSVMLNGIMSDPRFNAERPLAVGEDTSVQLTYWKLTLPDTMYVTENNADGNYEAVFSGEVKGEMVSLYRVCIGENQARSLLGYYNVDGVKMHVSVESFDLGEQETWSEDDYAAAYKMTDTINDVINAIMSSKQFSATAE